jgi:NAD(P)-dependent dehydrogenase (short-subunit alcohol dehydrogenase family)
LPAAWRARVTISRYQAARADGSTDCCAIRPFRAARRFPCNSICGSRPISRKHSALLIKPAVDVGWADWDDVVTINLKGAYFLSQKFAAHCITRNRPGCIVSIASTHGLTGFAGRSVYGISKGGLIQMTRMLAIEWAGHNIRVNAVAPSTALTPSRLQMLDPQTRERMLGRIPLSCFITPEEVAAAVCYLASPGAASITGQTLVLDGGLTAA